MTIPGGSSSSSPSPCNHSWTHDVFLSFRGPDTRYNFTCHLRNYLLHKGISTFIDDDELERGEQITRALMEAIEGSRISVIVFSEKYASSKWCLDELVHILYCQKSKQQKVYPVFYKVTPSDVGNQNGRFGEAFADLESDSEKRPKWIGALKEASKLAGWEYSVGDESIFIENIIREISMQVCSHADYIVADYPVGIDCRLKEISDLLDVKSSDVRVIGIWGIAGLGKTTIAKAVYNSLACRFDGCCFLENVGEVSVQLDGPVKLRKLLLSKILRVKESELRTEACEGMNAIKNKLDKRKVLLVLDDVDQSDQLINLIGERKAQWFGSGSRIIITTRDKRVLNAHKDEKYRIYKPRELDEHEALELFRKASQMEHFALESLPDGYADHVLKFAQGLPLALQSLGKLLSGSTVEEWEEELQCHMPSLDDRLYKTFIRSYNSLEEHEKEVFLDIACFFKGKHKNDVVRSIAPNQKPLRSIGILEDKALIHIEDDHICMHNLQEELGKKIVEKQSDEPGERSRLWFSDDVYNILSEGKGTSKIKGVIAFRSPNEILLSDTCFSGMTNLKYFINCNADFSGDIACLPNEPRLIDWPEFPFKRLPLNYVPKKLVKLNMPGSSISELGDKFKESNLLKYINLESCKSLKKIPNFSGFPKLKDLNLDYCTSLAEVDDSVGTLGDLVSLSLSGCHKLVTFPTQIRLTSVKRIILRDCISVTALPEIVQEMPFLTLLDLSGTSIKELPDASVKHLIGLEELILRDCKSLTSLPSSIYELQHLRYLDLYNCSELKALPQWNAEVPRAKLQDLNLTGCKQLQEIPELPPTVKSVIADGCILLQRFAKLSTVMKKKKESRMIERITLYNCNSLIRDMEETNSRDSLCSLFLCCRQSEFEVVFPGNEVPEWFSHSKKLKDLTEESRFSFEITPNFKLGNRGLAICAAAEVVDKSNPEEQNRCSVTATIDINGGRKISRIFDFIRNFMKSGHLWLCYIPFKIFTCGLSLPFTCGVTLEHKSQGSVQCTSYGVHLVKL